MCTVWLGGVLSAHQLPRLLVVLCESPLEQTRNAEIDTAPICVIGWLDPCRRPRKGRAC